MSEPDQLDREKQKDDESCPRRSAPPSVRQGDSPVKAGAKSSIRSRILRSGRTPSACMSSANAPGERIDELRLLVGGQGIGEPKAPAIHMFAVLAHPQTQEMFETGMFQRRERLGVF